MSLAEVVQLLKTALVLLALVTAHPELPQSTRDNASAVARNAIAQATLALATASPAHMVSSPVVTSTPPVATPSPMYPISSPTLEKSIDIFIIAGQSNATGLPPKPALRDDCSIQSTIVPTSGTAYYYDPFSDSIKAVGQINCGGAWPAFAAAYVRESGKLVVFVETAVGSSALLPIADGGVGNWSPETQSGLYARSISQTKAALAALRRQGYTPLITGVLWSQGEAEVSAMSANKLTTEQYKVEYPAALKNLFVHFKSDLGSSVQFFLFRTGTAALGGDTSFKLVRETQESTAASTLGMHVVFRKAVRFFSLGQMDLSSIWTGGGAVHYSQKGYDEMGTIGAQNVLRVLNGQAAGAEDRATLPDTLCTMTTSPAGTGAKLAWWNVNGETGSIDNGVGSVVGYGSRIVNPAQTTTYAATFYSSEGVAPGSCSATVVVASQTPQVHIDANGQHPSYKVPADATGYTLNWSSTNASSCTLTQSDGTTYQTWPFSGSGPSGLFFGTNTLTCSNSAGSASDSVTISRQ